MEHGQIFHLLPSYGMCFGSYTPMPDNWVHPVGGTMVDCRVCGRPGVIPDEGHELEFLPPGTERNPAGGFTWKLPPPD